MSYLFDTATLVEPLRKVPSSVFVRKLTTVPVRDRYTSVISVSQILIHARREKHPRIMQDILALISAIKVLPFDLKAAQTFSKLRTSWGAHLDTDDAMIAAIAISRDLTLVTKRAHTFSGLRDLRTEDWIQENTAPNSALPTQRLNR